VSWVGDYDPLDEFHYWAFACDARRDRGVRTDFAYFIDDAETPTLERIRFSVVAPQGARPEDWTRSEAALLERLSSALAITKWRDRDGLRVGIGRDRIVEAKLFVALPEPEPSATPTFQILSYPTADSTRSYGHYDKTGTVREVMRPMGGSAPPPQPPPPPRRTQAVVESLVVTCFSGRLESQTREAEWDLHDEDSTGTWEWPYGRPAPEGVDLRKANVLRALRGAWPEMASVLDSTRAGSDQIRLVDAAVAKADRLSDSDEKDLVLYSAHLWANLKISELQGSPTHDCNTGPAPGADSTFVDAFNAAFSARDRSRIQCDREGAWWYSAGFIDSVVPHAGINRWADYAFLDRMENGWNVDYYCSSDTTIGSDEFRPMIARGEPFVKAHPSSIVAPEVKLLIAEAHETAWALSKNFTGFEEVVEARYVLGAAAHRSRAIELYQEHLRERPDDPRNPFLRRRLARMRLDVDTGYRGYYCSDE